MFAEGDPLEGPWRIVKLLVVLNSRGVAVGGIHSDAVVACSSEIGRYTEICAQFLGASTHSRHGDIFRHGRLAERGTGIKDNIGGGSVQSVLHIGPISVCLIIEYIDAAVGVGRAAGIEAEAAH